MLKMIALDNDIDVEGELAFQHKVNKTHGGEDQSLVIQSECTL